MAKRFRTVRPDGSLTNPEGVTVAMTRAAVRIVGGEGPFRIRLRGENPGVERGRADCLLHLRKRLIGSSLGDFYSVLNHDGQRVNAVRVVQVESTPVADLGCAPGIEVIHAYVWDHFKKGYGIHSLGRYYCRYIDGTSTVSKHGYWGHDAGGKVWYGAAEDIGARSMGELHTIADYIVAQTKSGRFDAATVIVENDIWTPAEGWHHYGGDTHYHVHVDVAAGQECYP